MENGKIKTGKSTIFWGATVLALGIYLSTIMTTKFLGISIGISWFGGVCAGALTGWLIGSIGIVLCGTGIGIPVGIVMLILGSCSGMTTLLCAMPIFTRQEHAVSAFVYIPIQIIGIIMLLKGVHRYYHYKRGDEL